ncbi:uncharacterized protein TM35_000113160 [Trypanosoma theileri]|uniref:Uncharacterized protein n=1 Tax=Trypanosoma theileri TaxID=67003 RepID=A0A1X0NYM1_9TRYP|nr:uncharacterized protein TM35_000113160 [Trypanosoma theileri]ORC89782.1 hypothetical protein TM35_000113160 [Trypanosoma theileri]
MSNSRGVGRSESDGKENHRRRQRSESASSTGWQITSNSRCIVCGRLGDTCDCRTTRMDPMLKRQKLDNFLLNTPYVRCKQMKALDDVTREESRQRRRWIERWGEEFEVIAQIALTRRRMVFLKHEELTEREVITATERKEWAETLALADRYIVLLALARHEREERLSLYMSAEREAQKVMIWHSFVFQLLSLQSRETALRNALINHEAAAIASLKSLDVELLNVMDRNEKERCSVCKEYWEQREEIVLLWQREVESLQKMILDDKERVEWIMQERYQMFELCVKEKTELVSKEMEIRGFFSSREMEERNLVQEKIRCCEEQRDAMAQQESSARIMIIQNVDFTFNELLLKFKHEEEEIRKLNEFQYQQSENELRQAIHYLQMIVEEEKTIFAALIAQEHHEKDQRYQWMLEKERQRTEFEHNTLYQIQQLYTEEEEARHVLKSKMQEDEIGVAAWIQHKLRKLRELEEAVLNQKGEIRMKEHEERFALVSHKAEHEDAVRRWIDQKEIVRQSIITEETSSRANGIEMEHAAREEIAWHFDSGLEKCHSFLQERKEAQVKFQQKALAVLGEIMQQEVKALALLQDAAQMDMENALEEEKQRVRLEFLNMETEQRSCMLQQEIRCRENISTQMQLQRNFFAKEAQELLKARLCEIMAVEESQRHVLLHLEEESAEHLWILSRRSWEDAQRVERERIREELRQREIALMEDERLYCEDEVLIFDKIKTSRRGEEYQREERDEDDEDNNDDIMNYSCMDETWKLQRQYVLNELGLEEKDGKELTPSSVEFLVKVMNLISEKKALVMAELHQAEKEAEEVERKVEKQKILLSNAKERCEELKEKLNRDTADHERRTAMYRDARQKEESQLERERERLQTKTEELSKMQEKVSGMREAIHNQYQRR